MVFSSNIFLFGFLPYVLAAYYLAPRPLRNALLLAASLLFYAWGERQFTWVLLVSIAGNYAAGVLLARCRSPRAARLLVTAAVAGNLLLLVAFKYANFLADNLNLLLPRVNLPSIRLGSGHLPIGVSFFTFQAIAYVLDVYRRAVPAERSPVRYALYAALFPHLVAGPIVRYRDIAGQLADRRVPLDLFASGVRRLTVGLAKKVLLANTLAVAADRAFGRPPAELDAGAAWVGLLCYSLQIYFDFSGYSDMAIGLGRLFGFDFLENFRHPYAAASVTEFWRRWHISLSSWLRDYIYIPLGGGRGRPGRVLVNLMIVFVLCGLWHGAAWTFLAWSLWHGAFLIAERVGLVRALDGVWRPLRHAYALLAVIGGWVFFRSATFAQAGGYLAALFGAGRGLIAADLLTGDVALALAVAVPACLPVAGWLRRRLAVPGRWPALREAFAATAELACCCALLFASVVGLAAGSYHPFLYFRF
jgi:alginate O-acetyltransferase complex protein AlgI